MNLRRNLENRAHTLGCEQGAERTRLERLPGPHADLPSPLLTLAQKRQIVEDELRRRHLPLPIGFLARWYGFSMWAHYLQGFTATYTPTWRRGVIIPLTPRPLRDMHARLPPVPREPGIHPLSQAQRDHGAELRRQSWRGAVP